MQAIRVSKETSIRLVLLARPLVKALLAGLLRWQDEVFRVTGAVGFVAHSATRQLVRVAAVRVDELLLPAVRPASSAEPKPASTTYAVAVGARRIFEALDEVEHRITGPELAPRCVLPPAVRTLPAGQEFLDASIADVHGIRQVRPARGLLFRRQSESSSSTEASASLGAVTKGRPLAVIRQMRPWS